MAACYYKAKVKDRGKHTDPIEPNLPPELGICWVGAQVGAWYLVKTDRAIPQKYLGKAGLKKVDNLLAETQALGLSYQEVTEVWAVNGVK
jgi:hypothetical protein